MGGGSGTEKKTQLGPEQRSAGHFLRDGQNVSWMGPHRPPPGGGEGDYLTATQTFNLLLVIFSSLKENLVDTQDAIQGRESAADVLERHFSLLETTFVNMQWRLSKLARQ